MALNQTHDPERRSWVVSANATGADFPIQNLPLCVFGGDGQVRRGGVGIGDQILDLRSAHGLGLFRGDAAQAAEAASEPTLNTLMALGPRFYSALRAGVSELLSAGSMGEAAQSQAERLLVPIREARFELPAFIRSFSDFTCSIDHTKRLRGHVPDVLMRLPVAYNGRASSIRLDGMPVLRPYGQFKDKDGASAYGPEPRLDFELELAVFVGLPNALGEPIAINDAAEHIFGYALLNDWSARGIQLFENMLGPFLGKSFLTTISPWIITREALAPFRVPASSRGTPEMSAPKHLFDECDQREGGLNVELRASLQTAAMRQHGREPERIVTTNFAGMAWTFAQMVAHHSSNGCNLESGDVLASGTLSGPAPGSRACMAEINEHEEALLQLANGETRMWLEDGDEICIEARAARPGFVPIGFGRCAGRIAPASSGSPSQI